MIHLLIEIGSFIASICYVMAVFIVAFLVVYFVLASLMMIFDLIWGKNGRKPN